MNIESIKALLEKVTPGPWQVEYQKVVDCKPWRGYNFSKVICHPGHRDDWKANSEFIAQSKEIVGWLLKENEAERALYMENEKEWQRVYLDLEIRFQAARNIAINLNELWSRMGKSLGGISYNVQTLIDKVDCDVEKELQRLKAEQEKGKC